nr:Uncharacterised protein [Klebsiella pneumoniae]
MEQRRGFLRAFGNEIASGLRIKANASAGSDSGRRRQRLSGRLKPWVATGSPGNGLTGRLTDGAACRAAQNRRTRRAARRGKAECPLAQLIERRQRLKAAPG